MTYPLYYINLQPMHKRHSMQTLQREKRSIIQTTDRCIDRKHRRQVCSDKAQVNMWDDVP